MDTIKVRAQSQQGQLSYVAVVTAGWREGGLRSFYRGVSLPMVGVMCDNSAIFATNSTVLKCLEMLTARGDDTRNDEENVGVSQTPKPSRPFSHTIIAGMASGVASGFVLTPFELVKCRIQLWKSSSSTSSASYSPLSSPLLSSGTPTVGKVVRTIYVHEGGLLGFFQGCRATVVREVPGTLTWLLTYQTIVAKYHQRQQRLPCSGSSSGGGDLPPYVSMFAGGMAGVAYWTIGYPADFIKTRVQSSAAGASANTRMIPAILDVIKTNGVIGLYRGYGITIARAFPSNAILFTAYEFASGTWDRNLAPKFRS